MKSNEDIKIENTEKNESVQKISVENIQNKFKKIKTFNIVLIILNILFIIGIGLLVFFLLKSKKETNEKVVSLKEKEEIKELTSNKLSKNNTIIGTYSIKSGEKFQLFNPEKLNLTGDDYYIESLDKNNSLRNLRAINDDKGYYIPEETGEKSFKIVFKIILKNLNDIFKDNQELIKVDLSNLEMEKVLSMNSSFSGCENLKEVNLEGVNPNNLVDMAYTFEKCNNLKKLDLSSIKPNNTMNTKDKYFFF